MTPEQIKQLRASATELQKKRALLKALNAFDAFRTKVSEDFDVAVEWFAKELKQVLPDSDRTSMWQTMDLLADMVVPEIGRITIDRETLKHIPEAYHDQFFVREAPAVGVLAGRSPSVREEIKFPDGQEYFSSTKGTHIRVCLVLWHYDGDEVEELKIDVFLMRNQESEEIIANLLNWHHDRVRRSRVIFGGDPSLQLADVTFREYVFVRNPGAEYPHEWVENLKRIPMYSDRTTGNALFWNRLTNPSSLEFVKDWHLRKFSDDGKKWIVCEDYESFKRWFGNRKCCLYVSTAGK